MKTREKLVIAARELYEERGINACAVKDITAQAHITRSLFYHYFENKTAITEAVLNSYLDDFTEALSRWFIEHDRDDVEASLRSLIHVFRHCLFDLSFFRRDLNVVQHSYLYTKFMHSCAEELSEYLYAVVVKDYERTHSVKLEYLKESFYVLITGLVAYVRHNPDVDDEVLVKIIKQSLHLKF